ncbi:MAG: hypothetical protein AB7T31_15305 [Gemmatimonadales bacterium]
MLLHERAPDALNPLLDIPDLASEFPGARNWLPNHLLNMGVRSKFDVERRRLFLAIIRRTAHALTHFAAAREFTLRYARWDCSGAIPATQYFGAIEGWENCLLQYQILIAVMNDYGDSWRAYQRNDGSRAERMCEMANCVKHATSQELTPLWLEADGIAALGSYRVSYLEIADELRDACSLAEGLVDPTAFLTEVREKRKGRDVHSNVSDPPSPNLGVS